ncbi:magnesium chelatase subunit D family protein [Methanothermobacter sp.]|uniref:magnesium chelatase subunit D family protein n=1 Tax=Methanothermobacter sp. TaxID=1884223 RepID=UPI00262C38AE|nr:magnesium chelatase subunit D family protein [Methanothermobacter sp.]MDI9615525.1 magnesium chelatase subunit D family protein [Methanothermobacter sp.]
MDTGYFPFTAITGQEMLKKALLLNAVNPAIGGVLIRGDKGTGKSTAVRALSDILPERNIVDGCRFGCDPDGSELCMECQEKLKMHGKLQVRSAKMEVVDLPVSATEDMVVGTIDIRRALHEGIKALEPGLLARANGNILYIDEVNLLDDHVVNVLLDAAAMGVNIVEREGISVRHPSRFILAGTMNPEEGDLRPQIIDRFGLSVDVEALTDPDERIKVIKRALDFQEDPEAFHSGFRRKQEELQRRIMEARSLLSSVEMDDDVLLQIVEIASALGIRTHRADIITARTARTLAAFNGRNWVNGDDVKEAALLAMKHRLKQLPFQREQELSQELIEDILNGEFEDDSEIDRNRRLRKDLKVPDLRASLQGHAGPAVQGRRGKYVRARENPEPSSVAVDATLRRAAAAGSLRIEPEHLMEKVRVGKARALYIMVLDTSSSMRLERKIKFAKTVSWLLLRDSYEKRNRIALIAFRGYDATVVAEPTSRLEAVEEALEGLKAGGRTPLTPALKLAAEVSKSADEEACTAVVISDGRCNVFINSNLEEDLRMLEEEIGNMKIVFVNAEPEKRSLGILEDMASRFNSEIFYLDDVII